MTVQTTVSPREGKSTREVVIEAATRLIHLQGYQKTSIDDVLSASGVGKGNFYHYFKSKEDLGYAILDRVVEAFLERALEPCFHDREGARSPRSVAFSAGSATHSMSGTASVGASSAIWRLSSRRA